MSAVVSLTQAPRSIFTSAFCRTACRELPRRPAARSVRPPQAERRLRPSPVSFSRASFDPRLRNVTTRAIATRRHFFVRTPVSRVIAVTRTRPAFVVFTRTGTLPERSSRSWLVLLSLTSSDFFFAAPAAPGASSARSRSRPHALTSSFMRVEPP
jgi:hypothetical protein